ncbi:MAG TPA: TolC family protein [Deltaproteobacteria bacterium]|nr:TolC family protein [Deltaproteobacteria bacterium]
MIGIALFALAAAAPLSLEAVLGAVDARVPELAAAEARLDEAQAKLLTSRGALDPALSGKLSTYSGKDPRRVVDTSVRLPTAWGPEVQLGWALGQGSFPAYDADRQTGALGELQLRVELPLLDGLGLSEERAAVLVSSAGVRLQEARLADEALRLRNEATRAYWRWASAGARLQIERALLEVATSRGEALLREVELGARARLGWLDNERARLERLDAVAQAEQELATSALALSLWYRDASGRPLVPEPDALPPLRPLPRPLPPLEQDLAQAPARPDVQAVDALLEAAGIQQRRAGGRLLPDVSLYAAWHEPASPDGYREQVAGASLELSAPARRERGARAQAQAVVSGLQARRRGALDAAYAELSAARLATETAWQRVLWTQEASERAAEVVALERRRLQLGGVAVFQLLSREANLARAQGSAVEAIVDHELALAARRRALGAR